MKLWRLISIYVLLAVLTNGHQDAAASDAQASQEATSADAPKKRKKKKKKKHKQRDLERTY